MGILSKTIAILTSLVMMLQVQVGVLTQKIQPTSQSASVGQVLGDITPMRVQTKSAFVKPGSSVSLTFNNPTTSGNHVILAVSSYYADVNAGLPWTISDNKGNAYKEAASLSNDAVMKVYYADNINGGSNHQITMAASGSAYLVITAIEYSGLAQSGSLDVSATNRATSASYSSDSISTTQTDELLIGFHHVYNTNAAFTPDSGWTTVATQSDGTFHEHSVQERMVTSTGSYNSTGSLPSSLDTQNIIVSFKTADDGSTPSPTPTPVPTPAPSPTPSSGGTTVTWTNMQRASNWPAWIAWTWLPFDPVSQQTIFYVSPSYYTGIYSTHPFFYNSTNNTFTDIGGTNSTINACPADTSTQPGDRHPQQLTIDTKRNLLWMYGGVNINCPDNPRQDMYYLSLNANPLNNTWTRVFPAQLPNAAVSSAMVYDSEDDVLFSYGPDSGSNPSAWVYCSTLGNSPVGVLTAKQLAAGCASADNWTQIQPVGDVHPPGYSFAGMVYDTVTKKVILYGGMNGGLNIAYNETWAYDVPTKTWTKKALSTTPPPVYNGSNVGQPAMVYNTLTKKILYRQTHNTGAPAEWEYDPVLDSWTKLVSVGGNFSGESLMGFDAKNNRLIAWNRDASTGYGNVWQGQISNSGSAPSPTSTPTPEPTPPPVIPPPAGSTITPLIIQEAIYPGVSGIARSQDPLSVGIPLADNLGITSESQLGLSGAALAQFRILGRWPSGNAKWVLIDTEADISAGGQNTSMSLTRGSGNFGGSNLATDNGSTITINTGHAQFTIKKANFNGIDKAVVNGKTIVESGTSEGLVVTGPTPGQTTCGNCNTVYSSANDAQSTAVIEENGPVKTVIKATGYHKDSSGNKYMAFTLRMYFYKGKGNVKLNSQLQNADYGPSNSFNSAYKGFESYDFQLTNALPDNKSYSIGTHSSPSVGSLSESDNVSIYQAQSNSMRWQDWCGFQCVPFTTDSGYQVRKNGTVVVSGNNTQYAQGWADLSDSSGAGIEIGAYQMAAYWPKSLEFNDGGADVRIGIWPKQNSTPHYQSWPQYSVHDVYLNFHDATLASPQNEFLKEQHYLVARAPHTHYNDAKVFPYPLLSPAEESNYYTQLDSKTCCIADNGLTDWRWPINIYRWYAWGTGSGANQTEFRWSNLLNFLQKGFTGRYLDSTHFYRMQVEQTFPRSDSFSWRDRPHAGQAGAEIDGFGRPSVISQNSSLAHRNWMDQEHAHWYGMPDYYFMTGDESIKDALLDGPKDYYLNPDTYQANGQLFNSRSVGGNLISRSRFYEFLKSIGDSDADQVLTLAQNVYAKQIKPDLCVSGYPVGCSFGAKIDGGPFTTQGVSRVRGVHWGASGTSGTFCGVPHSYRGNSAFQNSILLQGLWEFLQMNGTYWPEYENALDLAFGISQWELNEMFVYDGTGQIAGNGYRYGISLDVPNECDENYPPVSFGQQTVWFPFYIQHAVKGDATWKPKFDLAIKKLGTLNFSDMGQFQIAAVMDKALRPGSAILYDIAFTAQDLGSGNYRLTWTVPANTQSYKIKWGNKKIVDWIGFDAGTNQWIGDPMNTMNWFAANNILNEPSPASAGTVQTMTLNTGISGLKAENFSVKGYISGSYTPPITPTPVPPTTSILGDLNNDDIVNSIDLSLLTSKWNQNFSAYDLNSDGIVNSLDYVIMVQNWSQ